MSREHVCPVCGKHTFKDFNYEWCPICNWQDDLVQYNEHDYCGGANKKSVNQARAEWHKKVKTA